VPNPGKYALLLVAFVEGLAVMALELSCSKLLAPGFGTSLYVWTGVIAVTLGALAAGYHAGGVASMRLDRLKLLYVSLGLAAVLIVAMPTTVGFVMGATLPLGLKLGVTVAVLMILFPPLFLLGLTSPIIIREVSEYWPDAGRTAGRVYGLSTIGGVIGTPLFGLLVMPHLGLTVGCRIIGSIVGLALLCSLVAGKQAAAEIG